MKKPRHWRRRTTPNFDTLSPTMWHAIEYLWVNPNSPIALIRDALPMDDVDRNSLDKLLCRLRDCGVLEMIRKGRNFVYSVSPPHSPETIRSAKVEWFVRGLFQNSSAELVELMVRSGHLDRKQLLRVRRMVRGKSGQK
jgi:predicted transcriptional regulator